MPVVSQFEQKKRTKTLGEALSPLVCIEYDIIAQARYHGSVMPIRFMLPDIHPLSTRYPPARNCPNMTGRVS